jgi:hypothetical protein
MCNQPQPAAAASLSFLLGALLSLAFVVSLLAPHIALVTP